VPYLIALAAASNVGSVATLTGNPQNMLVGSYSGVSSRAFLLAEAPVALVGLAAVFLAVWLTYHRRLPPALAPVARTSGWRSTIPSCGRPARWRS
jgi:Na+/H+ antiporter NhaD/arsenite permease-like protein